MESEYGRFQMTAQTKEERKIPHYSDGTEAKVGDLVVGTTYNQSETLEGTIVSITPGSEACNAIVQFLPTHGGPDLKVYPEGRAGTDWDYTATGDLTPLYFGRLAPGPQGENGAIGHTDPVGRPGTPGPPGENFSAEPEPEQVGWGHMSR